VEIQTETIPTWTDFMRLCASDFTDVWHFRGALDNWVLETALERTARNWLIPLKEIPQIEQALLREFMRAYPPDASTPPPDNNDTLAWLSLMQHHGAPTRLLVGAIRHTSPHSLVLMLCLGVVMRIERPLFGRSRINRWPPLKTWSEHILERRSRICNDSRRPAFPHNLHGCGTTDYFCTDCESVSAS
jgi:hypothetical protein